MKPIYQAFGVCAMAAFLWLSFDARAGELEAGFKNPPPSARPWVYWFPLDGNITSNGITADLEAMRRVGIGGVLYMETDVGTPPGPAAFGGPRWRNLFKYICSEANRLGLEVNMNNDAGWAGSGGPWITPALSMQKVVWSETPVRGPLHFDGNLPQPETVSNYYHDIAVLAFPTPAGETVEMSDDSPAFSSSLPADRFNAANLVDGDPATAVQFPKPRRGQPDYIQIEFDRPFAARHLSLTLGGSYRRTINGEIQISDDGKTFKTVREFETKPPWVTLAFDKVAARYYRIVFTKVAASLPDLTVAGLKLSPACRVDLIEAKSDLITRQVPLESHWPKLPSELTIPRDKVVDISPHMNAAGHLDWDVPPGSWTILRIGHTSTGQNNYPAPSAGRGLECDKLSKAGAK
ncbi:MAG TPA: glycosyl hydrolase, partial [Candidatus Binatia bacterium]|nr:glycosyl hydrolase [Candidatus Binatia bacterium]